MKEKIPSLQLNRLETHDRMLQFHREQANSIAQGASDCMMVNKLSLQLQDKSPYVYLFAHARTNDDGSGKRLLWQPRLTKPKAVLNSYLFRGQSKTDLLEIIWILPPREMWNQYKKGMLFESEEIIVSINNFENHRNELEMQHPEDLPEERIRQIYREISKQKTEIIKAPWVGSFRTKS